MSAPVRLRHPAVPPKEVASASTSTAPKGRWFGPSVNDLLVFTRGMAVMLSARLPLSESLGAAAAQARPVMQAVVGPVRDAVEGGASLHEALAASPGTFNPAYLHLVEVGETTGLLGPVFERLADRVERTEALRRKLRAALAYPLVVVAVALGATAFILFAVVPTFASLYADFGVELPGPTRFLLGAASAAGRWGWLAAVGLAGAAVALSRAARTPRGRAIVDRLALRVPVLGPLTARGLSARAARTLSTLLASSVPLLDALMILERSEPNVHFAATVRAMAEEVRRGGEPSRAVAGSWIFPPFFVQMMEVGERTGRLAETTLRAADHLEREVETLTAALTSVLEPVLILVVGVLLGGVLIALYLPLLDVVNAVQ